MAHDASESGMPADWQGRLDGLSRHLTELESQIQGIREQTQELRRELALQAVVRDTTQVAQPPRPAAGNQGSAAKATPGSASAQPTTAPAPGIGSGPTPPVSRGIVSPAAAPSGKPSETIGDLEARIGGAWLSWSGGLLVLIGAIWFFKYAIDQNWIGPWVRVTMGWVGGFLLLALGEWAARQRMPWFAAGVTGVGVGLGYMTGYAASPLLYELTSLSTSYAVLSCVTAIGLVQAVRLAQQPTAVLSLLGGFLTLLLLKSPHPTAEGLLGYLLALGVGALGAGQIRLWPALRYLAWTGTAGMIALWLNFTHIRGSELPASLPLLSALFVLYQLDIFLWRCRRPDEQSTPASQLAALNGTGLLLAFYGTVLENQVASIVGAAFFAVAAFQAVLARWLWTRHASEHNRRVAISLYGQASLAVGVGLPVAFDRFWIVLGWAAQAITIAWLVQHVRAVWLRLGVAGLLVASVVYIVTYFDETFLRTGPDILGMMLPGRAWLAAVVAAAGGVSAYLMACWYDRSQWKLDRAVAEACLLLAALSAVIAGATLLSPSPKPDVWMWMFLAGATCLGLLTYRASYLRLPYLMVILLLAAAYTIAVDHTSYQSVFDVQAWGWLGLHFGPLLPAGLTLAALGFWNGWLAYHARTGTTESRQFSEVLSGIASVVMLLILRDQLGDDDPAYAVLAATAGSLVLALAGRRWIEPGLGIWSGVTWTITALYWIVAVTVNQRFTDTGELMPGWAHLTPFANMSFVAALGLIATAWPVAGSLGRSGAMVRAGMKPAGAIPVTMAAYLLLHALSFEVDRWCQVYAPARFADPAHVERVALSVLWALLALAYVIAGLVFSVRGLRLMGLVLFAVTTGKVLLVDMARVAVLYRMLSAMGLGVLALAGSFAYQRVRRLAPSEPGHQVPESQEPSVPS
jgi:uncharacterized membrane protein